MSSTIRPHRDRRTAVIADNGLFAYLNGVEESILDAVLTVTRLRPVVAVGGMRFERTSERFYRSLPSGQFLCRSELANRVVRELQRRKVRVFTTRRKLPPVLRPVEHGDQLGTRRSTSLATWLLAYPHRGRITITSPRQTARVVDELAGLLPDGHLLVLARSAEDAQELSRRLDEYRTGLAFSGAEVSSGRADVTIAAVNDAGAATSPVRYDAVICIGVEAALNRASRECLAPPYPTEAGESSSSPLVRFLIRTSPAALAPYDELRLEEVFGWRTIRFVRKNAARRKTQVVWLHIPSSNAPGVKPNLAMASAITRLTAAMERQDANQLRGMLGDEVTRSVIGMRGGRMAVLVRDVEQAGELREAGLAWPLVTGDSPVPAAGFRCSVMTQAAVLSRGIDAHILLRADGGRCELMPRMMRHRISRGQVKLVIDAVATPEAADRRYRAYREHGYRVDEPLPWEGGPESK